jgi:hypothetical protein
VAEEKCSGVVGKLGVSISSASKLDTIQAAKDEGFTSNLCREVLERAMLIGGDPSGRKMEQM